MANLIYFLHTFIFFFAFAQANNPLEPIVAANAARRNTIVPIAVGRNLIFSPFYIVRATIGTPAQALLMAIDTRSDTTLVPCAGCVGCSVDRGSPMYDPSKSTTFKSLGCNAPQCLQVPKVNRSCHNPTTCGFNTTYNWSTLDANLAQDSIALAGTDSITGHTFACMKNVTPAPFFKSVTRTAIPPQGVLGLGRGPLSLLSQTSHLYQSTFSYCFPIYDEDSTKFGGSLILGRDGQPKNISTTPLLQNPKSPSLYYVNLTGIVVGDVLVNVPSTAFAFNPSTGAGTVFDSGTILTTLVKPAYMAVREEIRRQSGDTTFLGFLDTCYGYSGNVPNITLMFPGLNMTLPKSNFILHRPGYVTYCLAMVPAPETGIESGINIIGSFAQQNQRILVDIPNSKLGVASELCT